MVFIGPCLASQSKEEPITIHRHVCLCLIGRLNQMLYFFGNCCIWILSEVCSYKTIYGEFFIFFWGGRFWRVFFNHCTYFYQMSYFFLNYCTWIVCQKFILIKTAILFFYVLEKSLSSSRNYCTYFNQMSYCFLSVIVLELYVGNSQKFW